MSPGQDERKRFWSKVLGLLVLGVVVGPVLEAVRGRRGDEVQP